MRYSDAKDNANMLAFFEATGCSNLVEDGRFSLGAAMLAVSKEAVRTSFLSPLFLEHTLPDLSRLSMAG